MMIKIVSDLTKLNWNEVWEMGIEVFFTYVAFNKEYNRRQADMKQQAKIQHR